MAKRKDSDEYYVIDLCDELLGYQARRGHRFDFLRGDTGAKLPVDAYYPDLQLVVEYRERQHTEPVEFWDHKPTVSGVPRGQQRALYDQRRRELLPQHGIELVELSFLDLAHDSRGRLKRNRETDMEVIQKQLTRFISGGQHESKRR